jgi:hypothetical protein
MIKSSIIIITSEKKVILMISQMCVCVFLYYFYGCGHTETALYYNWRHNFGPYGTGTIEIPPREHFFHQIKLIDFLSLAPSSASGGLDRK